MIEKIIEEAAKILKDYPHLKYYEAISKAKEVYKKDPQDCSPKGANKNINN